MNGKSKYEPAFPQSEKRYVSGFCGSSEEVVQNILGGMSLRDYFAAKAMQGLSSNQAWLENAADRTGDALMAVAKTSFEVADAMLEARK